MGSENKKTKVEVIGRGNVGNTLARIFGVSPIAPRTLEGLSLNAELYIIAVSDTAVAETASRLPGLDGIIVHTTGSVGIDVLKNYGRNGYGVLYPFQTISGERGLKASDIPLLIEASNAETAAFIKRTAEEYGFDKIQEADSTKRRLIHLAGVFANNFSNAMIGISQDILEKNNIDRNIINPLIAETVEKVKNINAIQAQTGPASRKDKATIELHRQMLLSMGMQAEEEIYGKISELIGFKNAIKEF